MCEDCWQRYGSPAHTSPEIERAVKLIGRVYEDAPTGGSLHVHLDDWNIDRAVVAMEFGPDDYSGPSWEAFQDDVGELVRLLKVMPVADRAAALAWAHGLAEG